MIMRLTIFTLLSILSFSCSYQNIDNSRNISSALEENEEENEIDPKFESYEGGSHASEKAVHQKIIDFSIQMLEKNRHKYKKIPRDAHAKSHGCYKGKFIVDNKLLPPEHRLGVFKENKTYKAYLRYSNNDHLPKRKYNALDLRGMAIKLLGVSGEKIMPGFKHELTQDFLMYGSKIFFIKDNKDYVGFIRGLRDENAVRTLLTEQPKAAIKTVAAQFKIRNKINPLDLNFFSATPIRLGARDNEARTAVKYGVFPCTDSKYKVVNFYGKKEPDYMRKNLMHTLKSNGEACFDFKVQRRTHPKYMPIEDATIAWPETKKRRGPYRNSFSPYVSVAKVIFTYEDNKNAGSEGKRDTCEDLSFSPWHALPEHRPLGRTMRMRRDVYRAISDFRRKENNASFDEPTE
jgi:hypothetical protein